MHPMSSLKHYNHSVCQQVSHSSVFVISADTSRDKVETQTGKSTDISWAKQVNKNF